MKAWTFILLCLSLSLFVSASVAEDVTDEVIPEEVEVETPSMFSDAEKKAIEEGSEQFKFQAEVNSMMSIIVNSIYTQKEIFLRELISNASDALDKIRFASLTDSEALGDTHDLEIRITFDKEAKTLTIRDTGIGMTRQDTIDHLGTLAKSGSKEFLKDLSETAASGDANLIGQFGVGFYSAYLVSDLITVVTKNNKDPHQHIWTSENDSTFSVSEDPRGNTLGRGTEITLLLKEDSLEYLEGDRLTKLIKRYSEFITFPIHLHKCVTEHVEVEIEDDEEVSPEDIVIDPPAEPVVEDDEEVEDEDKPKPKRKKMVDQEVCDWHHINNQKPIWTRSPKDVTEEEYNNLYKAISKDHRDPLTQTHFAAEGDVAFKSVLYIPEELPMHLFQNYGSASSSLKLYVRRVFITDKFDDLMPRYLSFVKGVIDSDDLPLNVNRENLSHNRMFKTIRRKLVRKSIELLKTLVEQEDGFEAFWKQYSTNIKLGVIEDNTNRNRLAKLLRWRTNKTEGETLTSLETYIENMKEDQTDIYFIAGEDYDELMKSPFLERLHKKNYEVFILTDPVDEYVIQNLREYDGHEFKDISRHLDLGADAEMEEEFKPLCDWLKEKLSDKVEKAVVSSRLTSSPIALSAGEYGYTANMERLSRAQTMADPNSGAKNMRPRKTLEINPYHPIIVELRSKIEVDTEDAAALDLATLLFDTGCLQSGFQLEDPSTFASNIHRFLKASLGVDPDAEAPEIEEPAEEEVEMEFVEDDDEEEEIFMETEEQYEDEL